MYTEDTIAAISTPQGTGGVGIIRISGNKSFEIAAKIFKGKKPFEQIKSHTISYGKIIDPKNHETIDEVLLTKMKKPESFTREDIIEINCHGGIAILKKTLSLVLEAGARIAEPGEFTKRAFLNGRIDLSQAEAVIDIIHSKTHESSRAAINQLEGKLSKKLKEAREGLIDLIAHIEVTVDYPEHDIEEITGEKVYNELLIIQKKLMDILKGYEKGRILREGLVAVIIGKPNVGKSSLMNELLGKERAIVTEIPGTTRDTLEEYININGIPIRLIDTAGIRETEDVVERIGIENANRAMQEADLVILMLDADTGISEADLQLLKKVNHKKIIILINKVDLAEEEKIMSIEKNLSDKDVIRASIKEGIGIEEIEKALSDLFYQGEIKHENDVLVTNVRHKDLIDKAIKNIEEARASYENAMPLDCITIDIKNAAENIGSITGESASEDVIHRIFSKFCLGK